MAYIHHSKVDRFASVEEKLTKNITKNGDCWEYNSGTVGDGYRTIKVNGKCCYAHRISYEFFKGPIPEGLVVDHLCHNRACINPNHLRTCTQKENCRGVQKIELVCRKCGGARKQGGGKNKKWYCPTCLKEKNHQRHLKNRTGRKSGGQEKPFCEKHNCQKTPTNWSPGQAKWYCKLCRREYYLANKERFWKRYR